MKRKIANWLLRYLYNAVSEEDILRTNARGKLVHRGVELNEKAERELVSQARTLEQLPVWKILLTDMKYLSNKRMFDDSKTQEDMMFGKAMLFVVDVLEKKVHNLSKFKR